MKEFRCGTLIPGCPAAFQAESEEEILEQAAVHARDEHGMHTIPAEVADQIRASIDEAPA